MKNPVVRIIVVLDEAANAVVFHLCWELLQSHPVKFCDAGSCCTSKSNENHSKNPSQCALASQTGTRITKNTSSGNLLDKGPLPQSA